LILFSEWLSVLKRYPGSAIESPSLDIAGT
jgi:hypothetical protein